MNTPIGLPANCIIALERMQRLHVVLTLGLRYSKIFTNSDIYQVALPIRYLMGIYNVCVLYLGNCKYIK